MQLMTVLPVKTDCKRTGALLERYFDGESSRRDTERVEAHLAACPHCVAELASLKRTRGVLQGAMHQAAASVDFETVWRGIAPRLAGPKPGLWERLGVAVREYFQAYRPVWVMAGAAAAIAALVAVPLLMKGSPSAAPGTEVAKSQPKQSNECIIESIESANGTPMVQELPNQTKVIWTFEEPEDQAGGPSGL